MKAYKGFNPDLTCNPTGDNPFQFAEGQTYEEPRAQICERGFHAVTMPLDAFNYYGPASSVYHEVEIDDDASGEPNSDSKVVSRRITIGAKISIAGLVKAQVQAVWDRCTLEKGSTATGNRGAASSTGDYGAASSTGDYGAASSTGNRGAASSTGDYGAASSTGYQGAASSTGADSVAMVSGYRGRAKGAMGCALLLVERDSNWHIVEARAVIVGRKSNGHRIKPNVWYGLVGGRVVEVDTNGEPVQAVAS